MKYSLKNKRVLNLTTDYEEIFNQIQSRNESNVLCDTLISELRGFISKNINTNRKIVRPLLFKKMEELKHHSKYRLTKLLIDIKDILPILYDDDFNIKKLRYSKFVISCLKKTLGIPPISKSEHIFLNEFFRCYQNKNELIKIVEFYLSKSNLEPNSRSQVQSRISEIGEFLSNNPQLNELINNALMDHEKVKNNILKISQAERETEFIKLFTQKEIDRIIQIISKYPDVYYLIFPFWDKIADDYNFRYTSGKRKALTIDTDIIKWILSLTGNKNVDFHDKRFKKIQKRWNTYKNNNK
jgi:predicted transcriptional regulator